MISPELVRFHDLDAVTPAILQDLASNANLHRIWIVGVDGEIV